MLISKGEPRITSDGSETVRDSGMESFKVLHMLCCCLHIQWTLRIALHRRDNLLENVTWNGKWKVCGQRQHETFGSEVEDPRQTLDRVATEIIETLIILKRTKTMSLIALKRENPAFELLHRWVSSFLQNEKTKKKGASANLNYRSILVEGKQTRANKVSIMQHTCMMSTLVVKKAKLFRLQDHSLMMEHIRNSMDVLFPWKYTPKIKLKIAIRVT